MSTVLLVEDNELNRDMLTRRLSRKGYKIMIAVDGQAGVDMARQIKPELILMDMSLPVMDGWEAARQIKGDPSIRSIPIIALTAHAMAGDREKALQAGCEDYDTKPVELDRLLGKMIALLNAVKKPTKSVSTSTRVSVSTKTVTKANTTTTTTTTPLFGGDWIEP